MPNCFPHVFKGAIQIKCIIIDVYLFCCMMECIIEKNILNAESYILITPYKKHILFHRNPFATTKY